MLQRKLSIFAQVLAAIIFSAAVIMPGLVLAQSEQDRLNELSAKISEYEKQITSLKGQANTLANQIAQYNSQIELAILKIAQTQEKIDLLNGRITRLEGSLDSLTQAFSSRATQTYKLSRLDTPLLLIFSSQSLSEAVNHFYYLNRVQEADRQMLIKLTSTQNIYNEEKDSQEELQAQLNEQKKTLDSQKQAKSNLLAQTKNNEKRYQELLAAARSEFEAIQAIIAGKGTEEEVGKVGQGARIASMIQGSSCNSSGTHLHFLVRQGTSTLNPFNFLHSIDYQNCSGSACNSGDGDPFNPSGSWDWPINSQVKFSQGYGVTWAVNNTWVGRIYSFHNGIDIYNDNPDVRAVKSGTLFRGSYGGSSGCRLRYVRVDHDDSDLDTLYLHVNY